MRQIVCDLCTSIIPDENEIFELITISQGTKIQTSYEICDNCKVKFYLFLRSGGKKDLE